MDSQAVYEVTAVMVLAGVLVYAFGKSTNRKEALSSKITDTKQLGGVKKSPTGNGKVLAPIRADIKAVGKSPQEVMDEFDSGASIYVANSPYLFGPSIGNIIPSTSTSSLPGAW
jgi:hypothetical protein